MKPVSPFLGIGIYKEFALRTESGEGRQDPGPSTRRSAWTKRFVSWEDLLNKPIPQKLLQAPDDKRADEPHRQGQGSPSRCLHPLFSAPPMVGGLRLSPFHSGLGSTEFFSRPVCCMFD
jgi:hypothetical protein